MIAAFVLLAAGAMAHAAEPVPTSPPALAPAVSAAPPKYHIELEAADIASLSAALMELPKRLADPLIEKINKQLQAEELARQSSISPLPKDQSKPPEAK
jgi:predicted outer membrane protein